jgi:hypothetical protein
MDVLWNAHLQGESTLLAVPMSANDPKRDRGWLFPSVSAGSERRSTRKSCQRGVSHFKILIAVSRADADAADYLSFDNNW